VSRSGRLQVGNQTVTFDTVSYDDESTRACAGAYTTLQRPMRLISISLYSSGLADAAAAVAEQYKRL
jgi:hypothetical protein